MGGTIRCIPFTDTIRNTSMTGEPEYLKSSGPDTQLGNLNVTGLIRSQGGKAQVLALSHQRQGEHT